MPNEDNVFIPRPERNGETYGDYLHRLEEALVRIAVYKNPPKMAIEALAFIAMEAPADFDSFSIRAVPPFRRMRDFLGGLPAEARDLFRVEAMKLPRGREDRVNRLLSVS